MITNPSPGQPVWWYRTEGGGGGGGQRPNQKVGMAAVIVRTGRAGKDLILTEYDNYSRETWVFRENLAPRSATTLTEDVLSVLE